MKYINTKIKFTLLMLLLNNLVFSNFNYPRNLNVLLNSDESLLIGTDSVVFSWDEPEDDYRITFLIDNIDDNGDGSVDFDVSFLRGEYFPDLRAFNIGIRSGDANLQINSINGGLLETLNWSKNVNSNVIQANNVDWVLYLEYDDCGLDGVCPFLEVVNINNQDDCLDLGGSWINGQCATSGTSCNNSNPPNPNWLVADTGECNNICEDQEQVLSWVDENGDDDCGYYFEYEEMESLVETCSEEFISQREWNFNDLNGNQVCDQDVIIDENTELGCNEVGGNWSGSICTIDECESYSTCHLFTMSGTYDVEYDQIFYIEHDYDETILYHTSETEPIADFQWLPTLWQPGNNIDSTPQNLDCSNCNVGFNNCPYQCPTPYVYSIYRYEFDDCEDSDDNNVCDDLSADTLGVDQSTLILLDTFEYQDQPYDIYNDTYTYFSDSNLNPRQGYCYYVTASHPTIPNGQTSQEDALDEKLCIITDCVRSLYYLDIDEDGLGDINHPTDEEFCGPDEIPGDEVYVDINFGIDEYPECPNFIGENPYDCHGDCFDWNDSKVKIYYETEYESGVGEWLSLSNNQISLEEYELFKQEFCSYCADEDGDQECDGPDNYIIESGCAKLDDECFGYCYEGLTGREKSIWFEEEYSDNGQPNYIFGGAKNCAGDCHPIDLSTGDVDWGQVDTYLDACGWCCSCDPNNEDGEECIPPYTVTNGQVQFNGDWNECSYYNNGDYAGHFDCSSDGSIETCWYENDITSEYGPAIVNECGFCDELPNCGATSEVEDFNVEVLSDSISIYLEWTKPSYYLNMYSYEPDIAVNISSISLLDFTDDGYEVAEIELKIDNNIPLNSFSIQISSELLIFYDNQGYGGRAEDIGMSTSITSNGNSGQIFATANGTSLGIGNEVVSKFRVKINKYDCLSFSNENTCDDYLGEMFYDNDNSLTFESAEDFEDLNGNLKWDRAEYFIDSNNNDIYDLNEILYDCDPNTGLCSDCPFGYPNDCSDKNTYHPFGSDEIPGNDDDCPCNDVGICKLHQDLSGQYNTGSSIYNNYNDCMNLYYACRDAGKEECQNLDEDIHVWIEWNDSMGDGIWNDAEPYTDSNGNNEYDIGEYFSDYGLDGCPDEYETGAPTFGCNSEPNYLTLFDNSDPNQDNSYGNIDGQENNFEYDKQIIDEIMHFTNQSAFTDNVGDTYNECNDQIDNEYDCYMFLNTKWNADAMDIEQVGFKNDRYCYDSGVDGAIENESYYDGQPEDCAPDILYKINKISGNYDQEVAILYDNFYVYDDNSLQSNTEYCFNVDTQVIYNYGSTINGCSALDCFEPFVQSDNVNFILESQNEECVTTGCDFEILYTDSDGDGFGDSNESVLWCPGDASSGLVSNDDDEWPYCYNEIIDQDPYDCTFDPDDESTWNTACNGLYQEDLDGTCCNGLFIDVCGICGGNGNSCDGLVAPILEATNTDDAINLSWNAVATETLNVQNSKLPSKNIRSANDSRDLLTFSIIEIDDQEFEDDCGPDPDQEECIGTMIFKIELENYDCDVNCLSDFNINFNTNDNYSLNAIANYFFNVSVFNQGLVLTNNFGDLMNMNININTNNIYVESTGEEITNSGTLIYVEGNYNLDITGQQIIVSVDESLTTFLDSNGQELDYTWIPTLWTVGEDVVNEGTCGNGICESGESFFNCPDDCEENISYTIRRDNNIIASNILETTYTDSIGLEQNTSYCYTVVATNGITNSPPSNENCISLDCGELFEFYSDVDGDGLGDPNDSIQDCVAPNGYVQNANDEYPDCANDLSINPYDCTFDPNDESTWDAACNGNAVIDECGICNGGGVEDGFCDCNGNVEDCLGACGGDALIDECGICNGGGIEDGFCDCDGNVDDCLGICGGDALVDECGTCDGDGTECDEVEPEPEAPLFLTATSDLYREIQLNWQEPIINYRNSQPLQIVINNIVDDGNGNAEFWINMSNPLPVSFFNFQVSQNDNFSIINIDEEVGSISEANMEIFTSQNYISIENSEFSNEIPTGNGLFMIVNATYDLNAIGQISILDFSNMSFLDNLGEPIEVSSISTEWVIGSDIENIPNYCGDNICDENESINQSCQEDCSFSYIIVIDGTWVELNWIDLSYLHSGLGMGEEHCYEIKAKLNNDILYESPSVCATTQALAKPRILSIQDQGDDDGGYVILTIEPQKNDTISEGYFYEIFRQFNNGPWTSVDLFGAYGLDLYTVVTTTVADLTTDDNGDTLYNEHLFKVRYLDTVSDSVLGYSINNLAPDPVTGLELSIFGDILIELDWDSNTELDLGYYSVYSRSLNSDWVIIEETDDSNLLLDIPSITTEYAVTASDTTGNESEFSTVVTTETLDLSFLEKPSRFVLYPTYPNPFNPIANIRYGLSEPGWIDIKIYDVVGREIAQLVNKYQASGNFDIQWDASNYNSGLYFIKCSSQSEVLIQKILLVK